MRTTWWRRPLALILGVWFAMSMAEPAALHSCPTHGRHAAATPETAGAERAPGVPAAYGAAGHHETASTPADVPSGAGHQCTCLGDCSTGAGQASLLPATHPARWAPAVVVREAPAPRALSVALQAADFVLPFANGPPARA
jgi:hypothetical protein